MEIIGRVTADATISETKAGKKVVNFSIAINDTYKPKGSTEVQKIVTYRAPFGIDQVQEKGQIG